MESPNEYLFEGFSDSARNNLLYGEKGTFNVKSDPTDANFPIYMKITNISTANPPPTYEPIAGDYTIRIKKISDSNIILYDGEAEVAYTKQP